MNGQRIGYIRVSAFDQNPARQLESVQVDRTFTDKASGKDMDRLARNLDDLRRIVCRISSPRKYHSRSRCLPFGRSRRDMAKILDK